MSEPASKVEHSIWTYQGTIPHFHPYPYPATSPLKRPQSRQDDLLLGRTVRCPLLLHTCGFPNDPVRHPRGEKNIANIADGRTRIKLQRIYPRLRPVKECALLEREAQGAQGALRGQQSPSVGAEAFDVSAHKFHGFKKWFQITGGGGGGAGTSSDSSACVTTST